MFVPFVLTKDKLEVNQHVHAQMVNTKKMVFVMIVMTNVKLVKLNPEIV